eukprot:2789083-Rhodomonas_salina.1
MRREKGRGSLGEGVFGPAVAGVLVQVVEHAERDLLRALLRAHARRELCDARAEKVNKVAEAGRDPQVDQPRRRPREQEHVQDRLGCRAQCDVVAADRDDQVVVLRDVVAHKRVLHQQAFIAIG